MHKSAKVRIGAAVFITAYADYLILKDAINSDKKDLFYWPHLGNDGSLFIPSIVVLVVVLVALNGYCWYLVNAIKSQKEDGRKSSLISSIMKVEKDAQKKSR